MAVSNTIGAGDDALSPTRSRSQMATTTVSVEGMTCGACTSAVEGAFEGVAGAGEVSVSLMMGRAVVHHDPALLPTGKVAEMIEDCGFDATVISTDCSSIPTRGTSDSKDPETNVATTALAIEGMTCGACTSAVEGGLTEAPGVRSVSVSLLSERAVVEHDLVTISAEQLAEVIEDRGFGARVLETSTPQSGSRGSHESTVPSSQSMVTTVAIEGMTCGACTSSVQGVFDGVEGLIQFNISLLAERAVLTHNPIILTSQKIISLIEDAGFDAKVVSEVPTHPREGGLSRVTLDLHGLRDSNSATTLEDTLLRKLGIVSATISIATSRLLVSYDASVIGIRAIVCAIEAAGYNALLAASDDNNAQLESLAKTKEVLEWRRAFLISLSFAVPVFLINMILPMYLPALDFGGVRIIPGLYLGEVACLLLTIPVQFGIGRRFYITSFKSLKHRAPTMDVLVMLGTSAAFFYSVFTMVVAVILEPHNRPRTVFDTSTMLITFITLGRWLENRAKGQTSAALSRLMSLAPSTTTIYEDPIAAEKSAEEWSKAGVEEQKPTSSTSRPPVGHRIIPTELIEVGDIIILHPGDKVSADGIVIRGETYLDESMITGEAMPIHKTKGSVVIAGTVNGTSAVDVKVIRTGKDTQLSKIVKLVQDAQSSRASIQRMADLVAGYFVPTIISLGLITFFGWMFVSHLLPNPPKIFVAKDGGGKVMVCLKLCISVIVFACPCALGLSTPTAVMVGTGVGATQGILVKGGAVLESATKVTHVVFDKTGTLTTGKMNVEAAKIEAHWTSNDLRRRLWWLIVGLAEMNSEHPIGKTIYMAALSHSGHSNDSGLPGSLGDFDACVGKGISALVEPASDGERTRYRVLIGNAAFLRSKDVTVPQYAEQASEAPPGSKNSQVGITQIHVAIDGQFAGTILLEDTIKVTAAAAVAALHRMGISTSLITGDSQAAAASVASAVGIPIDAVYASVSPSDKQSIITSLQETGDCVAMVGDGINDSPALATASVGIALASGTDVAMEAADIVLMRPDDLLSVPASLSLSRSVFNRIKLNLVWACAYNVIGLPFAMGLFLPFGGYMLPPMAAGAAMALSSVSVVVSSLLLKFWKRPSWMDVELLEKEIDTTSENSQKNWWEETLFSVTTPSATRRSGAVLWIQSTALRTWSFFTGRPTQTSNFEPSYVPLQTVESTV
ncbi:Cu(2+)-transporting P-type ATPase CCC2 [Aspergillus lucknowensis]|uniref:E1-E2 ATPase-domain-containing protein n=1 Tax=Aspergillus lucknowensis TaxID=176173 RepID=A0ABR4L8C3_9EURO